MIAILGSGAFGTALAVSLAASHPSVLLWARDSDQAKALHTSRENAQRLPNVALPQNITISSDLSLVLQAKTVLLAVPMQQLASVVAPLASDLAGKSLVACCKGIDLSTGLGAAEILSSHVSSATNAILTGPSFARDIAIGLPTALTLACADRSVGISLQQSLTTPNLRIYRTDDVIGAALGGALKNVIAIACGAVMGAGLGESARAALMTRGYAEMLRMAVAMGAQPETLAGLSGFGDLTLTCTSLQSRNYQFGRSLGQGTKFDPTITVEGAATARAVLRRATALNIDMPITQSVVALIDGKVSVKQAVASLLSRPLKEE